MTRVGKKVGRKWIQLLMSTVHEANAKWWIDLHTGEPIERNVDVLLLEVVKELAEASEGNKRQLQDAHLPQYPALVVELADALIRILDMAGGLKLDLGGAVMDKLEYNRTRKDHTIEARLAPGGKRY